jgi:hypothetical protein
MTFAKSDLSYSLRLYIFIFLQVYIPVQFTKNPIKSKF